MNRLLIMIFVIASLGFAPAALAQEGTGTVEILHGVPGLDVDVYANGDVLLEGFAPGESSGPTELPAGDYDIAIRPAGEDPDSDPAIAATVTVPADVNATAIAHLDADGDPMLSVFVNDTSDVAAGEARLVVRHTAAFGAVDVLSGGDALISDLTNPDEAGMDVPAGTYDVAVTAAGDPDTQAFSGDLTLDEGTIYLVHAIGDPGADTFDLLIQTIEGHHTPPSAVHTGSGGLSTETGSSIPAVLGLLTLVALGLGIATPAIARRR
jgi:hypothetical protein